MKVKVTNPMVQLIKDALPKDHQVKLIKLDPRQYGWQVHHNGADYAESVGDYDYNTGLCKAIQIIYPPDFYAMPAYVTTKDLKDYYKECESGGDVTLERYKKTILNNLEV